MSHVYTPYNKLDSPVDPLRCKAAVYDESMWRSVHQCARKPWRDGWCKQHHPDSVKARDDAAQAKYRAECERRGGLEKRCLKAEADNERLRCAIEDAYREGWEAREGHAEECLGEAIMDAAWRVSEAAAAAKENK